MIDKILRFVIENPMVVGLFAAFALLILATIIFDRPVKQTRPQSKNLRVLLHVDNKSKK
jgi:hypothetical protein